MQSRGEERGEGGVGCQAVELMSYHIIEWVFLQGIVRLLRQSDAQLFAGWGSFSALSDASILRKIDHLAQKVATLLQVHHYNVVQ